MREPPGTYRGLAGAQRAVEAGVEIMLIERVEVERVLEVERVVLCEVLDVVCERPVHRCVRLCALEQSERGCDSRAAAKSAARRVLRASPELRLARVASSSSLLLASGALVPP